MRKYGAHNLQTMKRVSLAILSLVQSYYDKWSLKGIGFTLSLGFEDHLETIFKLLNALRLSGTSCSLDPADFYAFILLINDKALTSQKEIHRVVRRINSTPMKCLGYKTPAEVFAKSGGVALAG